MSEAANTRMYRALTQPSKEKAILFVCPRNDCITQQAEQMGWPVGIVFCAPGAIFAGYGFNEIWVDADCYRNDHNGMLREWLASMRCRLNVNGRMRFLT